jgi:AcrR family transcriptional regulator
MSPRPYQLGRRQEAADETRERVLAAARELLVAPDGYQRFTIDAIARQAGVARMTVYYRFQSKAGLLEALCDTLAMQSGIAPMMAEVFRLADPREALRRFLTVMGRFYSTDRVLMRRLHGLSALDPEFAPVLDARNERRRGGLRQVLQRLQPQRPPEWIEAKAALLHAITTFAVYDHLAGAAGTPEQAAPQVMKLALALLEDH